MNLSELYDMQNLNNYTQIASQGKLAPVNFKSDLIEALNRQYDPYLLDNLSIFDFINKNKTFPSDAIKFFGTNHFNYAPQDRTIYPAAASAEYFKNLPESELLKML